MTSAPRSPRMRVANGPDSTRVRSSTRTPANGPAYGSASDMCSFALMPTQSRYSRPQPAWHSTTRVRSVSFGALVRDVSDLLDYLIDRFAVVGSTDEVVNRFQEVGGTGCDELLRNHARSERGGSASPDRTRSYLSRDPNERSSRLEVTLEPVDDVLPPLKIAGVVHGQELSAARRDESGRVFDVRPHGIAIGDIDQDLLSFL